MPVDRNKIPERPVKERIKDFEEVALPFNLETAIEEARRCIQCNKTKWVAGCSVEIYSTAVIKFIAEGKKAEALDKIKEKKPCPEQILKNNKIVNIVPFELNTYSNNEKKQIKSYNKALDNGLKEKTAVKESKPQ